MPNLLINPGFELATGWTLTGEAAYSTAQARTGVQSAKLFSQYSAFGPISLFSRFVQTVPTVAGFTYPFRFWLRGGGSSRMTFRAKIDGSIKLSVVGGDIPDWTFEDFSFVASGTTAEAEFEAIVNTNLNGSATWYVDDSAVGEEAVARIGSEFPVRALMKTLYDNLNAELTHVTTERGDSKPLPAVENWYAFPRPAMSPDHCEVEVYETGLRFQNAPYHLARHAAAAVGTRAGWEIECPCMVALNFANREEAGAGDLYNRGRRYQDAILRVISDRPQLGYNELTTVLGAPGIRAVPLADTTRVGIRVECPVLVRASESSTGETTASGGVPPASVLEV